LLKLIVTQIVCQVDGMYCSAISACSADYVCIHISLDVAALTVASAVDAIKASAIFIATASFPERNCHVEYVFVG
jgi:hypothetical protein